MLYKGQSCKKITRSDVQIAYGSYTAFHFLLFNAGMSLSSSSDLHLFHTPLSVNRASSQYIHVLMDFSVLSFQTEGFIYLNTTFNLQCIYYRADILQFFFPSESSATSINFIEAFASIYLSQRFLRLLIIQVWFWLLKF